MTAPRHPANQPLLPGAGYSNNMMVGILLISLGGGAGVQLARAWDTRKYSPPKA